MKKTILTAFVALLVMLAVSCDNIPGQKPDTDDGFVTLKINAGGIEGSRSLNLDLARDNRDYVEVIFRQYKDSSDASQGYNYYRTEGVFGGSLRIKLPAGNYLANDAIALIGKNLGASDRRLLATALISKITNTVSGAPTDVTSAPFNISAATTTITFSATALVADFSPPGESTTKTPAFVVDMTSGNDSTASPPIPAISATEFGTPENITGKASYLNNNYFQLPSGHTGTKATITIGGLQTTGSLLVKGAAVSPGGTYPASFVSFQGPGGTGSHAISPAVTVTDATSSTDLKIDLIFSTVMTPAIADGNAIAYMVTLNIPVFGYEAFATPAGQITWHIRGGTVSGYDHNNDENDAIPLLITNHPVGSGSGIVIDL